jgi:hypothetical protein
VLSDLPADGQFDFAVDTHVDDYGSAFDCKSLVDLAEVVGAIDALALGAKAHGQFLEIGLSHFSIFRRKAFVHEIVPLLGSLLGLTRHRNLPPIR